MAGHNAPIKRQNPGSAIGNITGGGSSPNKALAIALGVGIPVILLVAGLIWWLRRRKAKQRAGKPPKTGWGKMRKGAVPKVKARTKKPPTNQDGHTPERGVDDSVGEKPQGGQGDDRVV